MLYGRWHSRHRVSNIESQGENRIKQNKRRAKKNSRMQDKKKRRTQAANYLIEGNDKYIRRYPEEDLVKILKDSGYYFEEWEETDPESLRKNPPTLKQKRVHLDKTPASVPPIGAQSWCLNEEALKRFNRSSANILVYDYDTDDVQDNSNNDTKDEDNNGEETQIEQILERREKLKKN
ncbi:hypothetical protein C1645_826795 [Glomus cerebriforme]|uniref:Uncharacterized protein n=1 Tax=Glomus cerebriforme TaxID=658196 RepID=A0A397SWE9_9GLOM|nr:hypothetical protein C1645_826795 [Glomus cerebriforme]